MSKNKHRWVSRKYILFYLEDEQWVFVLKDVAFDSGLEA
jgi:hypothetical protein